MFSHIGEGLGPGSGVYKTRTFGVCMFIDKILEKSIFVLKK
jgi:hypothetical protein